MIREKNDTKNNAKLDAIFQEMNRKVEEILIYLEEEGSQQGIAEIDKMKLANAFIVFNVVRHIRSTSIVIKTPPKVVLSAFVDDLAGSVDAVLKEHPIPG